MRHWTWVAILACGLAFSGCRQPADSKSSSGGSKSAVDADSTAFKRYRADALPPVDPPLPPLDGGRVELSLPAGWRVLPRDPNYLVRLVKGEEHNSLPRITVKAEPAPAGVADVTEEAVADFVTAMANLSAAVAGRKVLEPERPIVFGDYTWSRHVRQLRARASSSGLAAVQSLATVRDGRLYTIELTVESPGESSGDFAKAVLAHRDAAYAVAANWRFTGAAAEPADEPIKEEPTAGETASKVEKAGENPAPTDSTEKNPD